MTDIFISYKREQREWVSQLVTALEDYGLSIWWDPKIEVGEQYFHTINRVIQKVDAILVIWSEESIDSEWVMSEASVGMERKNIIPILKDPVTPPLPFNILQNADLSQWQGEREHRGFQELLNSIQKYCTLNQKISKKVSSSLSSNNQEDADIIAWEETKKHRRKQDYRAYLKAYPKGQYHQEARQALKEISFKREMIAFGFTISVLILLLVLKR